MTYEKAKRIRRWMAAGAVLAGLILLWVGKNALEHTDWYNTWLDKRAFAEMVDMLQGEWQEEATVMHINVDRIETDKEAFAEMAFSQTNWKSAIWTDNKTVIRFRTYVKKRGWLDLAFAAVGDNRFTVSFKGRRFLISSSTLQTLAQAFSEENGGTNRTA